MILLDEFYKDLYMNVFKKWICMQENPNYIIKEHKDFIQIESSYGIAEVTFNLYCIIELKVVSKKKNEIDFYLHFQMNTLKHAVSLFNEMLESLLKLSDEAKTKVLLCCSGGLTTSYFAREINEANKLLKNAIEVSAVGYNQLYQIGKQFDIIFLAPQISYLHAQIQSILKEQVVLKIPPIRSLNDLYQLINQEFSNIHYESKVCSSEEDLIKGLYNEAFQLIILDENVICHSWCSKFEETS